MTEKERIDQIVAMLDSFVSEEGGHMNVIVEDVDGEEQVTNTLSVDSCNGQTACSVPTLHKGIDEELSQNLSKKKEINYGKSTGR